jgi:hypothetical protein
MRARKRRTVSGSVRRRDRSSMRKKGALFTES